MEDKKQKAIIIGAGVAGLTAAYEFLQKTGIMPVIYEEADFTGGLSTTIDYKGNKIDIGGHRFFSKSDKILELWKKIDPEFMLRNRVSRIFFLGKFFDYPISLNFSTISNLGLKRIFKIGISFFHARVFPIKHEKNLEDFFINRFGKELYRTFFKDYTQKVWGIPCTEISPQWGLQRVKGLSVSKAVFHFIKHFIKSLMGLAADSSLKTVETSLISQFWYPKYGPGYLWEKMAQKILSCGGKIHLAHKAEKLVFNNGRITAIKIKNTLTGEIFEESADYVISTMPVKDLINSLCGDIQIPEEVKEVSNGLVYRDFITVGVLLDKLKILNKDGTLIRDNWIYIQEKTVKLGRLQIFNNWSPFMAADNSKVWLGLEYFCNEGDELWNKEDTAFIEFAVDELAKIGFIEKTSVLDYTLIRYKKAYPAYFGTYSRFEEVRKFTDKIENLYLIGRNGMHRYNNMDHSMLSAIEVVKNISEGLRTRGNIWNINTETDYHENK